jgi:uncharacterized membrane protein YbhN (UPF0104 family)
MRKLLALLIKAAASGLLLYFAFSAVNIDAVKDRFSQIDPRWIGLGLMLLLVQVFLAALRWRRIIVQCGADLSLAQSSRINMIAAFFNQTLPSSVGGDAVRIWLLGKRTNWRVAAYSVLLDRVIGVVALAAIVVACLPWTLVLVRDPVGRSALLLIGLGCIAAGIVFVGLAWHRLRFLQHWAPTRHLAAAAAVSAKIVRAPRTVAAIFSLSFLIHFMTAFIAWCVARSVGANLSLLNALFLVLPVILIAIVPISVAGWGVREGAMVAAFGYAGLPPSDGLIVSLLYGVSSLAVGAIGGLVWTLTSRVVDRHGVASPLPPNKG